MYLRVRSIGKSGFPNQILKNLELGISNRTRILSWISYNWESMSGRVSLNDSATKSFSDFVFDWKPEDPDFNTDLNPDFPIERTLRNMNVQCLYTSLARKSLTLLCKVSHQTVGDPFWKQLHGFCHF